MLFTPTGINGRVEDQLISWIVCDCEQHGWPVAGLSEGHWLGGDSNDRKLESVTQGEGNYIAKFIGAMLINDCTTLMPALAITAASGLSPTAASFATPRSLFPPVC